jgi:polyhydroxybutyrate depolymerase
MGAGADAGPPAAVTCPTAPLQPGDSNGSLQFGGTARSYILHVPTGYTGKTPIPLVVDYHPILATNTFEEGNSGYKALGDTEGFAVVFPQGIDDAWNIGPCCTTSRTVDDLGFSRAVVQAIQAEVCVDPKRIYAVGYSMGGGMAHYLGCNAADLFASIAPAAFDLLEASEEPCSPSRPITEITFRGTADPIVPYDGGPSMPPNGLNVTIHFLGAEATFQKWAQLDGCTGSPSAPDTNGCSTYAQCQDGVEATLCTKQGGGHDTGNAQIAWAMLKAHPMP